METYITILNSIVLVGVISLAYIVYRQSKDTERLEKQMEEKNKECIFWKNQLKKYL